MFPISLKVGCARIFNVGTGRTREAKQNEMCAVAMQLALLLLVLRSDHNLNQCLTAAITTIHFFELNILKNFMFLSFRVGEHSHLRVSFSKSPV